MTQRNCHTRATYSRSAFNKRQTIMLSAEDVGMMRIKQYQHQKRAVYEVSGKIDMPGTVYVFPATKCGLAPTALPPTGPTNTAGPRASTGLPRERPPRVLNPVAAVACRTSTPRMCIGRRRATARCASLYVVHAIDVDYLKFSVTILNANANASTIDIANAIENTELALTMAFGTGIGTGIENGHTKFQIIHVYDVTHPRHVNQVHQHKRCPAPSTKTRTNLNNNAVKQLIMALKVIY
jgi:hypothetical protein